MRWKSIFALTAVAATSYIAIQTYNTRARVVGDNVIGWEDIGVDPANPGIKFSQGGLPSSSANHPVGKITAEFSVDSNGQGTYVIPIKVPPGVQGVEPNLTLSYNSAGKNGLAGVGWSVTGVSGITRCLPTLRTDGFLDPIDYDGRDRFCLDGQPLHVTNGTYGADGSTYGLELADQRLVTSFGDCGGGPCSFVVFAKNGTRLDYGVAKDTYLAKGQARRLWMLGKASDTRGNYITYHYLQKGGTIFPQEMRYTGNKKAQDGEPRRLVKFVYEDRDDREIRWVGKTPVNLELRLKSIQTYVVMPAMSLMAFGGQEVQTLVREYRLAYAYSEATHRSRIVRISECGGKSSECYGFTTEFGWQYNQFDSPDAPNSVHEAVVSDAEIFTLNQAFTKNNPDFYGLLNTFHETHPRADVGAVAAADYATVATPPRFADFNGDGKTDRFHFTGNKFKISFDVENDKQASSVNVEFLKDPDAPNNDPQPPPVSQSFEFADFDGDRKADILMHSKHDPQNPQNKGYLVKLYRSEGDGTFTYLSTLDPEFYVGNHTRYIFADFNGDGRSDLLATLDGSLSQVSTGLYLKSYDQVTKKWLVKSQSPGWTTVGWRLFTSNGTELEISAFGPEQFGADRIFVGEFNGDGRADFAITASLAAYEEIKYEFPAHGYMWEGIRVFNAVLNQFEEAPQPAISIKAFKENLYFGDFNGDQLTDFVATFAKSPEGVTFSAGQDPDHWSGYKTFFGTGAGFVMLGTGDFGDDSEGTMQVINFNGDAKSDLLTPKGVMISSGWSFWPNGAGQSSSKFLAFPGDFNGDGRADIKYVYPRTNSCKVIGCAFLVFKSEVRSSGPHPDVVSTITDEIGGRIDATYKPLTDNDIYKIDAEEILYPDIYIQSAFHVVTSHRLSEQVKGNDDPNAVLNGQTFYHKYINAKVGLRGAGWLGFERRDDLNPRLCTDPDKCLPIDFIDGENVSPHAIRTLTTYDLNPYGNRIDHVEYFAALSDTLLSSSDFEYKRTGLSAKRVRNELQAEHHKKFINGALAYTSSKKFEYDSLGNTTLILDLGDSDDIADDLYTHTDYKNINPAVNPASYKTSGSPRRLGYPVKSVITSDKQGDKVLSMKTFDYDDRMNVSRESNWDDTHSTQVLDSFIEVQSTHDAWGNAILVTDPSGGQSQLSYDEYGFLKEIINVLGHTTRKKIDPRFGVQIEQVEPNLSKSKMNLDALGRTMEVWGPNPQGVLVKLESYAITEKVGTPGVILQTFHRANWDDDDYYWAETWKTAWGTVIKTRARGIGGNAAVVLSELDACGRVIQRSLEHFEGVSPVSWMKYQYDIHDRIIRTDYPEEDIFQTVEFDIGPKSRSFIMRSPSGLKTLVAVNSRGQLVMRGEDGMQTKYAYDLIGRLTSIVELSTGDTTSVIWDSLGRRTSIESSAFGKTSFEYDATGHLVTETDANGNSVVRTYDALDRTLTKQFRVESGYVKTSFEYDSSGMANSTGLMSQVVQKRYLDNNDLIGTDYTYQFSYDSYGQQTISTMQIGTRNFALEKTYDPTGDVREITYPDGSRLKSEYASSGALKTLWFEDGIDGQADSYEDYVRYSGFRPNGQFEKVKFHNGVTADYDYYEVNQSDGESCTSNAPKPLLPSTGGHGLGPTLRSVQISAPNDQPLQDLTYYWKCGSTNIEEIRDGLDFSYSQSFAYDQSGRLVAATGIYGARTFVFKDGQNGFQGNNIVRRGDGNTTYNNVHNAHQLTGESWVELDQNNQPQQKQSHFTYDGNGNVVAKVKNGMSWTYGFDGEDNLETVKKDGAQVSAFGYDFAGNRIRKVGADKTISLYIGSAYALTIMPSQKTLHTKYINGVSGRLVSITAPSTTVDSLVEATYLALSQKMAIATPTIEKSIWQYLLEVLNKLWPSFGSGVVVVGFVLVLVRAPQSERFGPHSYKGFVAYTTVAAFLISILVPDQAMAAGFKDGPNGAGYPVQGVRYFHTSHVNSAVLVTNENGAVVSRVEYEPFGKINKALSYGINDFRAKFGSKELDDDSGLYYFNARYYDPDTGRFLSPDTSLGADPLHHGALNRYAFAANNPITYSDPSGHFIDVAFVVGAVVAGAIGFLVAGTGGKIFKDPENAFNDFDFEAALIGMAVGVLANQMSFGLGSIGMAGVGGAQIFGMPVGTLLQQSFNSAAIGMLRDWASGERDARKLGASFGVSMMGGIAVGAIAKGGNKIIGGKVMSQLMASVTNSTLKTIKDPSQDFQLSVWAFNISFGKETKFDADYAFLAGQGVALANNLQIGGSKEVGKKFDKYSLVMSTKGGNFGFIAGALPKSYKANTKIANHSVHGFIKTVAVNFTGYAAPAAVQGITAPLGIDIGPHAKKGATKGIDAGFEALNGIGKNKKKANEDWNKGIFTK